MKASIVDSERASLATPLTSLQRQYFRSKTLVTAAVTFTLLVWLPLGVTDERQVQAAAAASMTSVELPAAFAPRAISQANLSVFAPTAEGDYLLVIDIITPEVGSLAAQGVEPTIVRVHVAEPAPAVTPTPAPTLAPTPSPSATASTSPLPPAPED